MSRTSAKKNPAVKRGDERGGSDRDLGERVGLLDALDGSPARGDAVQVQSGRSPMLTDEQKKEVVREFLENNRPFQNGLEWPYYQELLRSVAPKPKSVAQRAVDVVDKYLGGHIDIAVLGRIRAEISALESDGGEGKA